jgi:hypothetical protein
MLTINRSVSRRGRARGLCLPGFLAVFLAAAALSIHPSASGMGSLLRSPWLAPTPESKGIADQAPPLLVTTSGESLQPEVSVTEGTKDIPAPLPMARTGRTVIPGTWLWEIEADAIGGMNKKSSVFWQHCDAGHALLTALNGATVVLLVGREFDRITAEDLATATSLARGGVIARSQMPPGTVIGIRTPQGNLAKLKVIGYRTSHDFSFKEAEKFRPEWREFSLSRPELVKYHLEVDWVLYLTADEGGK